MSPPQFRVKVRRDRGAIVIEPSGELDLATVDRLREDLERHAKSGPLVLDLRGLSFMDSTGLALIVDQQRQAQRDGVDFRLVPGLGAVQQLFEVTGLVRHLRWAQEWGGRDHNGAASPP